MSHQRFLRLFLSHLVLFGFGIFRSESLACQSCLLPALHYHRPRLDSVTTNAAVAAMVAHKPPLAMATVLSGLVSLGGPRGALLRKSMVGGVVGVILARRVLHSEGSIFRTDLEDERAPSGEESDNDSKDDSAKPPVSSAMIATIGVYKNFISPLLPPACRFLPTCSQYGVQAIEEFGPTKGAILTAWRLMRCSPLGGKGYDPPRWPPVKYTYGSY